MNPLADHATTPAVGDPLRTVLREGRPVGAIAIEPATRRRMRVNGTIAAEGPPLAVRADQVFANCPKYIIERHAHELVARPPAVRATQRLTDGQRRRITAADTFFIATAAEGHGVDVSHRGGEPGFVEIADDGTVSWPDYRGNAMFMTLGNLHLSPRCGLLFLAWSGAEPSLHITGRARVDWDVGRAAAHPGAERMIDFQVESVYELTGSTLIWQ